MAEPVTEQPVAQQSVAGLPAAEALPLEHRTLADRTPGDLARRDPDRSDLPGPGRPARADEVAAQAATQPVAAQAAGENFPVALRMLPRRHRQHLMAVYVFARTADDIGDEAPAAERLRLLAGLEEDLRRLYASLGDSSGLGSGEERDAGPPRLAAVRGLARTVT